MVGPNVPLIHLGVELGVLVGHYVRRLPPGLAPSRNRLQCVGLSRVWSPGDLRLPHDRGNRWWRGSSSRLVSVGSSWTLPLPYPLPRVWSYYRCGCGCGSYYGSKRTSVRTWKRYVGTFPSYASVVGRDVVGWGGTSWWLSGGQGRAFGDVSRDGQGTYLCNCFFIYFHVYCLLNSLP